MTTASDVILKRYVRLVVSILAKGPIGVPEDNKAYNSFAVRADIINNGVITLMSPAEPNKVSVRVGNSDKASIGDFVWLDENKDGLYDPSEAGINGVTVELYAAKGTKLSDTVTVNNAAGKLYSP